jgi:hypothetical protein
VVGGSAQVPSLKGLGVVVGEIEAWTTNAKGSIIEAGVPWQLPNAEGIYYWTVSVPIPSGASPTRCVVQLIDPRFTYSHPQRSTAPVPTTTTVPTGTTAVPTTTMVTSATSTALTIPPTPLGTPSP